MMCPRPLGNSNMVDARVAETLQTSSFMAEECLCMLSISHDTGAIDRMPFDAIWLLWRTGELGDAEVAEFALARPDFRSWFNLRRATFGRPDDETRVHRGSSVESLPTKRTSSGCRDK